MPRRRSQRRLNIGGGEVGTLEQQGCLQGHGQAIAEAVAEVEGCPVLPLAEAAPAHQRPVHMGLPQRNGGDVGRLPPGRLLLSWRGGAAAVEFGAKGLARGVSDAGALGPSVRHGCEAARLGQGAAWPRPGPGAMAVVCEEDCMQPELEVMQSGPRQHADAASDCQIPPIPHPRE